MPDKDEAPKTKTANSQSNFSDGLADVIRKLEYAAQSLCEKTDDDIELGIIGSMCPEASLFISIRMLKKIQGC